MDASLRHPQSTRAVQPITFRAILVAIVTAAVVALLQLAPSVRLREINALLWIEARVAPAALAPTQRVVAKWLPHDTLVLAGDSILAMLPAREVAFRSVNFGIGGADVAQLRAQLRDLPGLASARALVLLVGTNDLVYRSAEAAEKDLRALLSELPARLPVLLCTVPPIDPVVHHDRNLAAIADLNRRWAACAAVRPNTHLVRVETVLADSAGRLRPELHLGDGLHLNLAGRRQLAALLQQELAAHTSRAP